MIQRRDLLVGACAGAAIAASEVVHAQEPSAAASLDRMAFWRTAPKGFVTGLLGRSPLDRAYWRSLAVTGARLARVFLQYNWDSSQSRYIVSSQGLSELGEAIRNAEDLGIRLVLTAEFEMKPNPPLWGDSARSRAFADAWRRMARLLRNVSCVVGYDLLNEPNPPYSAAQPNGQRAQWEQLVDLTLEAVRQEDAHMPLIVEGVAGGMAIGLRDFRVFSDPNLVYSIHFYNPHAITHQHVSPGSGWNRTLPYPIRDDELLKGTDIYPGPWDANRLRMVLQDAVEFQRRSRGAPMYVGEFSCVRWAPGSSAVNYISDCVSLFKEFGWSWTYHEYRGWPGWDAEIASRDPNSRSRSADAPVMRLLREEFARVTSTPRAA